MRPFKLAFGGKIGAGKSTAVDVLRSLFPNLHEISFAEPIKTISDFAFNIIDEPPQKDRRLLQFIGTEWGRERDPQIWIKLAAKKINLCESQQLIISDVRFQNEFEFAKSNLWTTVYLTRSNCVLENLHISEHQLNETSGWDFILKNNATKEDLLESLLRIIELRFGTM